MTVLEILEAVRRVMLANLNRGKERTWSNVLKHLADVQVRHNCDLETAVRLIEQDEFA